MEFYQVINNRRTVRDLTAEPIPADVLERIIAVLEQVERPVKNTLHFGKW